MEALIAIVVIIAVVVVLKLRSKTPVEQRQTREEFYSEQQERVSTGDGYRKQKLLNETEKQAYKAMLDARNGRHLRIFVQVSLGEVLANSNKRLYYDINSKRVDFLITDAKFEPIMAIEIHGTGHHNSTAWQRDTIKRAALTDAGIEYVSIVTNSHKAYQDTYARCCELFNQHI